MKNSLLYILVFSALILFSCKKEEEPNDDPFTNGTDFNSVRDYTFVLDTNDNIVSFTTFSHNLNNITTNSIFYYGDTIAKKTIKSYSLSTPSDSIAGVIKYYLNNLGYADSVLNITHFYSDNNIDTSKSRFQYSQDGFIISSSSNLSFSYTYVGNNFSGPNDEYYDYVAKADIFSYARGFDNELTGRNDLNLPKKIHDPDNNSETTYYYQFDNDGYVTSSIQLRKSSSGSVSASKYNFTYQFVQ